MSVLSSAAEVADADNEEEEEVEDEDEEVEYGALAEIPQLKYQKRVPDFQVPDECPYELKKDGRVLARLYGMSEWDNFKAYTHMVATDEGLRKGLSSLHSGTSVFAPWAKTKDAVRIQFPARTATLYRVMIGNTPTGAKKNSLTQVRLLYLCLSEMDSRFGSQGRAGYYFSDAERLYTDLIENADAEVVAAEKVEPLTMAHFKWIFSCPYHTFIDPFGSTSSRTVLMEFANASIHAFPMPKVGTAQAEAQRHIVDTYIIHKQSYLGRR